MTPHLATLSYAAPYLISQSAMAWRLPLTTNKRMPDMVKATVLAEQRKYARYTMDLGNNSKSLRPADTSVPSASDSVEAPSIVEAAVSTVEVVALTESEAPSEQQHLAHDKLVMKDNTWRTTVLRHSDPVDGELMNARLAMRTNTEGSTEWMVRSPVTLEYRVCECHDVLDPASDVLIYGHLNDPELLARAQRRLLKRVVVVDSKVYDLYGERIEAYFAHHSVKTCMLVLASSEVNKNMEMALKIAEAIHHFGIDRRLDPVIAIGGGVCMGIVGFAASICCLRTPYIRVPTTLMGYVHASIGTKTGVNFAGNQNQLGCNLPASLAILDRSFLASLDTRQLVNGASEVMKMALVKDSELFDLLRKHGPQLIKHKFQTIPTPTGNGGSYAPCRVLQRVTHAMLEEAAPNLWEDSLERLVDFGHVFSTELQLQLELDQLHHEKLFQGEAIAIDMAFCTVLASVRGHISTTERDCILKVMKHLHLPIFHPRLNEALCEEALYERVKFSLGQKIPLPTGLGQVRLFNDISAKQIREALAIWPDLVSEHGVR
eukprot:CAMPEP_0119317166 /NCGR_PEP_ID=MMETSP1333-20130426/42193_1 /TAXON_ID=418940 /ORGANISM="Scyphosphaera apsteinii, Strain RCC1455" /LENGTH=545 /DNA_ID=CAMNT_0007323025 /DNA_START=100 /DNA_END=1737 /DNA_ORIENTATION=+